MAQDVNQAHKYAQVQYEIVAQFWARKFLEVKDPKVPALFQIAAM